MSFIVSQYAVCVVTKGTKIKRQQRLIAAFRKQQIRSKITAKSCGWLCETDHPRINRKEAFKMTCSLLLGIK